jgi:hypothetical protein
VRRVATTLGVLFIGTSDEPRGQVALNHGVQSSSLLTVSKFKGERK